MTEPGKTLCLSDETRWAAALVGIWGTASLVLDRQGDNLGAWIAFAVVVGVSVRWGWHILRSK